MAIDKVKHRKAQKKSYEKNKDRILARRRTDYRKNSDKKKDQQRQLVKKWDSKNPLAKSYPNLSPIGKFKYRVKQKVYAAIKSGKLVKPDNCSLCDKRTKIESHHEDYNKPLDVTWVCRPCHAKIHRKYDWKTDEKIINRFQDLDIEPHFYKKNCKDGKTHTFIKLDGSKVKNCIVCGKKLGQNLEAQKRYYAKNKDKIKARRLKNSH